MLTMNQIKAKALVIGRTLERTDWHTLSAQDADAWCQAQALAAGVDDTRTRQFVAMLAMNYVITNATENKVHNGGTPQ